uniref:Nucleoprotein n=1 Tax=Infectious hematopoietic necrosis virus (strain Round Butte) TaxID=11291 RepID=NCAP_IHNVR|nr:RecName: Full=Nucleoprotein; Short=NP; AltName: Full=Nucleocapsid protein; Short=Protein N [Infectious hematopoietic necrosis virus - round butte]
MTSALRETFTGLRDIKGGVLEDPETEYRPGTITLPLFFSKADFDLEMIKRAVSHVGGEGTRRALGLLCAFVIAETVPSGRGTVAELLEALGFLLESLETGAPLEVTFADPNNKLAETIVKENVLEVVTGLLFTCALLTKYDVDKMATYCQNKLERLATSQGIGELVNFNANRGVLARIGAVLRPGQKLTKAIYGIILINLSDPATAARAKALCAMRLSGTGMTMVGLFNQAAKNLGALPADLLEDLCMKSVVESARRIVRLMRIVAEAPGVAAKYGVMMSRMLGVGYFKAYGINENARITCILMNINDRYDDGTSGGLTGLKVSDPFRKLAREIARLLVLKYDGDGSTGEGASDLIRRAEMASRGPDMGEEEEEDEEDDDSSEPGDSDSFL